MWEEGVAQGGSNCNIQFDCSSIMLYFLSTLGLLKIIRGGGLFQCGGWCPDLVQTQEVGGINFFCQNLDGYLFYIFNIHVCT